MAKRKRKTKAPAVVDEAYYEAPVAKRPKHRKKSQLCKVPGCDRHSQQGGVCCTHGAKKPRAKCSHVDEHGTRCTSVVKRGGLCGKHGAFDLANCQFHEGGCRRAAKHGEYCEVHARQEGVCVTVGPAKFATTPKVVRKKGGAKQRGAAKKKGAVSAGRQKQERDVTFAMPRPEAAKIKHPSRTCKWEGCTKRRQTNCNGYCLTHVKSNYEEFKSNYEGDGMVVTKVRVHLEGKLPQGFAQAILSQEGLGKIAEDERKPSAMEVGTTRAKRAPVVPSWLRCCIEGCSNKSEGGDGLCSFHDDDAFDSLEQNIFEDVMANDEGKKHASKVVGGSEHIFSPPPAAQTLKTVSSSIVVAQPLRSNVCCIEGCSFVIKRGALCSIHDVAESPTGVDEAGGIFDPFGWNEAVPDVATSHDDDCAQTSQAGKGEAHADQEPLTFLGGYYEDMYSGM